MSIKVNEQYLQSFIDSHEREYMLPYIEVAHDLLHAKKGAGNDFLGWLDLPTEKETEKSGKAGIDERDYYCKGTENYLHLISLLSPFSLYSYTSLNGSSAQQYLIAQ